MSKRPPRERVFYDTRVDRFLRRENIDLDLFGEKAGMSRNNLGRLRAGQKPRQDTVIRCVLAARDILKRAVAASEMFYLGEAHDDATPEAREYLESVA